MMTGANANGPLSGALIATVVADDDRLNFLPRFLGPRLMIAGESLVYIWMRRLAASYQGGSWDFYDVSNGTGYMAPADGKPLRIAAPNMFEGEMSADAAGIVATLYALCDLAERSRNEAVIERYHQLADFARQHSEWALIRSAID